MKKILFFLLTIASLNGEAQLKDFMLIKPPPAPAGTYVARQLVDSFSIDATGGLARGLTWLPVTYPTDAPTQTYPLMIFLHGSGEAASPANYSLLASTALPQLIANGFNVEAINPVDGLNYKFIVCSPQHPWWSYGREFASVPYLLNSMISKYRIDTSRIYVTGLSAGAQGVVSFVTNDSNFAKRIAAIVPVSFSGWNDSTSQANAGKIGSRYDVKMWNITGANDQYKVNADNLNTWYNTATPAPATAAPYSVIAAVGHDGGAWNTAMSAGWKTNVSNAIGKSIYEWCLQYKRGTSTPPPAFSVERQWNLNFTNEYVSEAGPTVGAVTWQGLAASSVALQTANGVTKTNLKDNTAVASTIGLQTVGTWLGNSGSGPANPAGVNTGVFPDIVIQQYWGAGATSSSFKITGLTVGKYYQLGFHSNNMGYVNSIGTYTVAGATTVTSTSRTAGNNYGAVADGLNSTSITWVKNIQCTAPGELTITVNVTGGSEMPLNALILQQSTTAKP